MHLPREWVVRALASVAVAAILASCGGGDSSDSDTPSDQRSNGSAEDSSPPSRTEVSNNGAGTVGDLILLSSDALLGYGGTYTLTFLTRKRVSPVHALSRFPAEAR